MPVYEYFCEPCNGIFEELRPIREASEDVPCPQCYKDATRIMPTSFSAFTFRDGYPRRIPDDGTFYHLGKKVTTRVTRGRPNEHPEINKPRPKPRKTRGERSMIRDMIEASNKGELADSMGNWVKPGDVKQAVDQGQRLRKTTPKRGLANRRS
jgi:putative FmdB family regulatory protein